MNEFLMSIITIQEINRQVYTGDCPNYCENPIEENKIAFTNDINVIKSKLDFINNYLKG